jgi:hypothetical protein
MQTPWPIGILSVNTKGRHEKGILNDHCCRRHDRRPAGLRPPGWRRNAYSGFGAHPRHPLQDQEGRKTAQKPQSRAVLRCNECASVSSRASRYESLLRALRGAVRRQQRIVNAQKIHHGGPGGRSHHRPINDHRNRCPWRKLKASRQGFACSERHTNSRGYGHASISGSCSNDQRASDTCARGGPRTPSDLGGGRAEGGTRRTPHGAGPSPAGSGQPATASAGGEAGLLPAEQ